MISNGWWRRLSRFSVLIALLSVVPPLAAQTGSPQRLQIEHSDQLEVVFEQNRYVTYATGDVRFLTGTGRISCDSARWIRGEAVYLNGRVVVDDIKYHLTGDSVRYDLVSGDALALGQRVELWSYDDSLYAAGPHAFYSERTGEFFMENRPVVYVYYPDTARMIEVVADDVYFETAADRAEAEGNVQITSQEFTATAECAVLNSAADKLDLFGKPKLSRGQSDISGELIAVSFDQDVLSRIDVIDSARGEFREPVDTANIFFDESILTGRRIIMNFTYGILDTVHCYGQAYSWYYPSSRGGTERHENSISGDTIRFDVNNNELIQVDVVGGAVGRYLTGRQRQVDSALVMVVDTIDYSSRQVSYAVADSLITLSRDANVKSGRVSLSAYEVLFDTDSRLIEAYSAQLPDSLADSSASVIHQLQPNAIPVILRDGPEEVFGDYLVYSIDTEKGRIVQSKSSYERGYYYGQQLYREQRDVFYVDDGRYTTCSLDEPHFHFHSSHMKLIENDKLIARPVVFYIMRIPVFALPYYVFPLKKGRHSGFLPFSFGRFERGERYVSNVGYYWAASDYWDAQGSFDYFEERRVFVFRGQANFKKRYVLDGYLAGEYSRETSFNRTIAEELDRNRWLIRGAYNHDISPSLSVRATADFQSDARYVTDYSQNIDERINRETKSQVSFRKQFGKSISLSGTLKHTENLDQETRSDQMPSLNLLLPTIYPFGNGGRDESGQLRQSWFQNIKVTYSPSLLNFSSRVTNEVITDPVRIDTIITLDTLTMIEDTVFVPVSDTFSYRSRREYLRIDHNPSLSLPAVRWGNFVSFVPGFSYSESWAKIFETDQSLEEGIDASRVFRTYSWRAGVSANSKLYGTVYPNFAGIIGLRHVISPSISYGYTPEIDRFPTERAYAGGQASSKSSSVSFSLGNDFQAKVSEDGKEKNIELLSVRSGFSYNFLNDERPLSNMTTSFFSSALPVLTNVQGSMTHTFYNPKTGEEDFLSPYMLNFRVDARFNLSGKRFFFDDVAPHIPRGADSVEQINQAAAAGSGWSLSATYSYQETRHTSFASKSSFLNLNLSFRLTATTYVTYTQRYDISRKLTINNAVSIRKKLHCWSASLYWVPIGSNRGFGFTLFVTDIPAIKLDNNYDLFSTQTLQQ